MFFPVVPNVPGVPPVNRLPGATFPNVVLLASDAISVVSAFASGPQWGIFLNGVQVVGQNIFNAILGGLTGLGSGNTLDLEFEQRFTISQAPQEQGAFASYNRVQRPYHTTMTVTAGGSLQNRQLLLAQVQGIMTEDLYTVLQPEGPIAGLNPVGYSYPRRPNRGLGLLTVTIFFEQVRPAGNPTYSTTSTPATTGAAAPATPSGVNLGNANPAFGSNTVNGGVVSGVTPPASFPGASTIVGH